MYYLLYIFFVDLYYIIKYLFTKSIDKIRTADLKPTVINNYDKSRLPKEYDAIIIGSGIGGMTTAALLSKKGYRVIIFEQSDIPGGCAGNYRDKGYDFDIGLDCVGNTFITNRFNLLLMPNVNLEWRKCGNYNDGYTSDRFYIPKIEPFDLKEQKFFVDLKKDFQMK